MEVRKVCNTSQTSPPKGVHLKLTTPAVVRPVVVQHDLVCAQDAAEVVVYGGVVESHRQDVIHGGAVATKACNAAARSWKHCCPSCYNW